MFAMYLPQVTAVVTAVADEVLIFWRKCRIQRGDETPTLKNLKSFKTNTSVLRRIRIDSQMSRLHGKQESSLKLPMLMH